MTQRGGLRVLIVGGGLGGLCLAQGLAQSGIEVSVFERDASAQFRAQGYRITIKADGSQALRDCLPEHLFRLCVATAIESATRMVFLDHHLNPKFAKPIPLLPPDDFFGVNRLTLREILLAGLEDRVRFGSTFERYEPAPDGQVRAYFADGASATGDLLVGADGTYSAVRTLLLPDAGIDNLHCFMYGKTTITAGMLEWVPDTLVDTFNRVTGPDGIAMSVATCRTREMAADATARLAPSVRLTDTLDYFSWTLSLDDAYRDADATTLHRLAGDRVATWHPAIRRLIAEADASATFPITVTSAQPVAPWQTTNVTLLGDAIHTMSPGRGEGANTALRDAALLRHALVEVATHGVPLLEAVARYESEMLRYGFEAVAQSRGAPFMRSGGS